MSAVIDSRHWLRRSRFLVALFAALVVALAWSLLHVRHVRLPQAAPLPPAQFSEAPPSGLTTSPSPGSSAQPPGNLAPDHLYIPSLGTDAPVVPQAATVSGPADHPTIALDSPPPAEVGRYTGGGTLTGSTGTVLIAGHVNLNGVRGALWNLSQVQPGADIWITDDQTRVTHWQVYANPVVPKDSPTWPVDVFSATGPRRLVLASCTGTLHRVSGYGYSYDDNQFVYAVQRPLG